MIFNTPGSQGFGLYHCGPHMPAGMGYPVFYLTAHLCLGGVPRPIAAAAEYGLRQTLGPQKPCVSCWGDVVKSLNETLDKISCSLPLLSLVLRRLQPGASARSAGSSWRMPGVWISGHRNEAHYAYQHIIYKYISMCVYT